jgi:sulfoxide reductase heme-binding subunit YedZ
MIGPMSPAVAVNTHLFWITSRAAGTAAMLLSSAAVCAGLLIGGKLVKRRGPDVRVLHEALSIATIAAIVVHAGALLGDSYLRPTILDLTVPFVSTYKTVWMSIGIVGGWSMALLGLSYYVRSTIGQERWRILHRFTGLAWLLGIVHSLGEGTDAGQIWFLASTVIVVVPVVVLTLVRTMPRSSPPSARAAR